MGPDWCPVVELARIASDPETDATLRVRCLGEVAPYLHPKRRAIEHDLPRSLEDLVEQSFADELKAARERVSAGRTPVTSAPAAPQSDTAPASGTGEANAVRPPARKAASAPAEPPPTAPPPVRMPVYADSNAPSGDDDGALYNPLDRS